MGRFLIVSKAERLDEHRKIAEEYGVGFEINDFYDPDILDDQEKQQSLIEQYRETGLLADSTMHGAFFDVVVFSQDEKIRRVSELRMEQSMEIARKLGVKGVVFHTNCNPMLSAVEYDQHMIELTCLFLERLLKRYSDIQIYMENMFDADPEVLLKISERMHLFENYGVCLDYAHASISKTEVGVWVEKLAPYVKHLHINDNDLKKDLHLAVGTGQIDWRQFVEYYKNYFTECSVLIETNMPDLQRASLEFLKQNFDGLIDGM